MNSLFVENILNSSYADVLKVYYSSLSAYIINTVVSLSGEQSKSVLTVLENLPESFSYDEFQWKLLKGFSLVLIINLLLIFVAWRIFGKRICERFMKPATSKAVEELKASVAKLKLPKEHTPRI